MEPFLSNKGELYLVATPIGNLEDIGLRAISVLKTADLILSEKPLKTKILLDKYQIRAPLFLFHEHSDSSAFHLIINRLKQGERLALVSEAGTPCIADPGGKLIAKILAEPNLEVKIVPIPGPSALTTALSLADFNVNRFLFLGFLPKKKGRKKFLNIAKESHFPVVVYESVYRIERLLKELEALKIEKVIVLRELTKKFESTYRGSPLEVLEKIKKDKLKGEFVVIIYK